MINFKWLLTGLNSVFSFSQTGCDYKVNDISLLYNLPIPGEGIIGFIPFLRVFVLCKI